MMKSADSWQRDDLRRARGSRRDAASGWPVLVESQLAALLMIVARVGAKQPNEMALIEHEHVLEELPSTTADLSFGDRILPGTTVGDAARSRAHRLDELHNVACARTV